MSTRYTNQKKVEENINYVFSNKGIFAAVAEKTLTNYKSKFNEGQTIQPNLHYFAVGHTFKNIDTKRIFDYQLSEDEMDILPTKYFSLQQNKFSFPIDGQTKTDKLYLLLDNIRNINAHFIHDFNFLKVDNIDENIICFLIDSFELALIKGVFAKKYGDKKSKLRLDFLSNEARDEILTDILENLDKELIVFMKEIFYQTLYVVDKKEWRNKELNQEKKDFLDNHLSSKEDWINWILFNCVEEDIDWYLNNYGDYDPHPDSKNHKHKVLTIEKGKYLSFEGSLFMMTMFLYANEANYLIPKLKGYKKNGTPQDASKLEVFRFFAKKFKSQDVDSEHKQYVKFRDMIQYVGKYPTVWNKHIHLDSYYVKDLKATILENEIIQLYQEDIKNHFQSICGLKQFEDSQEEIQLAFIEVAKDYLQNKEIYYTGEYREDCITILKTSAEHLANKRQLKDIQKQLKKYINKAYKSLSSEDQGKKKKLDISKLKYIDKIRKSKNSINTTTDKFAKRVEDNLLFISNGRNSDRFMVFACRFLAEINYFGKDAQFKMYENYYSEEEQNALKDKKQNLTQKEFDKLHYHGGKLTHFETFENHTKKYPNWDMPFVVQNNAIYVKIPGINFIKNTAFCIQRNVINYLLEHALGENYKDQQGRKWLFDYYEHKTEATDNAKRILTESKPIEASSKTKLKKLLPKKLFPKYSASETEKNILRKYLEQAEESEKLYENQKDKAKAENRLDLFVNKNKGKQFKLRFIFKAWQLMYFKKQYQIEKERYAELEKLERIPKNHEHEFGHHKKFNINRKEFNLFSKWLFAMDEVPEYKNSLKELLDDKNFFDNSEFQKLFESSSNINQFYESTKSKFKNWLNDQQVRNVGKTIQPENYYKMMEVGNFHINLSHLIAFGVTHNFIEKSGKNILRPITSHAKYLNTKIYDIDLEHSDASNLEKNIFRKLYKIRLEDCLLYEIALRYFQPNLNLRQKSYEQLNKLLVQKISITIKANNSQTYQVLVPFRDLEKFEQLKAIDDNTQNNFSLLRRLPEYLSQLRKRNENVFGLKDMVKAFGVDKSISLADMSMLYNHLITQQGRYTNCIMALEEYFIWKEECTIEGQEDKKFRL
jgi:hypothetical protein